MGIVFLFMGRSGLVSQLTFTTVTILKDYSLSFFIWLLHGINGTHLAPDIYSAICLLVSSL